MSSGIFGMIPRLRRRVLVRVEAAASGEAAVAGKQRAAVRVAVGPTLRVPAEEPRPQAQARVINRGAKRAAGDLDSAADLRSCPAITRSRSRPLESN